jgi:outer membrane protein
MAQEGDINLAMVAVQLGRAAGFGDRRKGDLAMKQRWFLGAAALALLPFTPASAETLADALVAAYSANPTIAAERAQLRVTDEDVPQALAQRRPTVTAQAEAGLTEEKSSLLGRQVLWPRGGTLSLSQPLWTGGRAGAAISQAEFIVQAERANLYNIEESVLLQAATSYLDVVRDQALLDLATSNVKVLKTTLDQTRAQLNAGLATKTDLAQSEARLALALADQEQAAVNLANSRAAYRQAVGHDPVGLLAPAPAVGGLPESEISSIVRALQTNPQVLIAQSSQEAARAGVDLAYAGLIPSVSVSAQLERLLDQQIERDRLNAAGVLVTLTVPVYQAGAEYSRIRQSKETLTQNQDQVAAAERQATQVATQAWENLQAARAKIQSFQAQIDANRIAYNGTVEEQRVGTRTVLDVLNAQQELFSSETNLVGAQHDEAVSAYQLKTAIGDMTAVALNLSVERYDPRRHYDAVRNKWIGTSAQN